MNIYKGKVEIFDDGRVPFPVEVEASSWQVAMYRAACQGIKIYRKNRQGKRVNIKSVIVDLTRLTEWYDTPDKKTAGVPIGLGGSGTRDEALKMIREFHEMEDELSVSEARWLPVLPERRRAIEAKFGMTVEELETKLKHKRG